MMTWNWQDILMYVTLAAALAYLCYKFLGPYLVKTKKGSPAKDCGDGNCGCH